MAGRWCAERLLQRIVICPVDCCVFATWVRFPKMTGGLAKGMRFDGEAENVCRYNDLVAFCRASGRACGGGHWGDRSELF